MEYNPDKFQCSAFAVISEESMIPLCEKYGIDFLMFENDPVGMKKNAGLSKVTESDFDYLIELGSDDLILNDLLDSYYPLMKSGEDFFGSRNLLLVDSTDGNSRQLDWDGDYPQGLGRCMSKKLLSTFGDKVLVRMKTGLISDDAIIPEGEDGFLSKQDADTFTKIDLAERVETIATFYLWDKINRGLDNNSNARIMKKGFKYKVIETPEPLMADIKSDENIWAYNPFIGEAGDSFAFINKLSKQEKALFFENQKKLKAKRVEFA